MKEDRKLEQSRLRQVYSFDADTGVFTRLEKPFRKNGGHLTHNGYLKLSVDGVYFRAHRLAWLYHFSEWPGGLIDHKNGNKLDNRITNLRAATKSQNGVNRGPSKKCTSGFKGVTFVKKTGRWKAQIMFMGKNIYIGQFEDKNTAALAYQAKGSALFGEFFRAA